MWPTLKPCRTNKPAVIPRTHVRRLLLHNTQRSDSQRPPTRGVGVVSSIGPPSPLRRVHQDGEAVRDFLVLQVLETALITALTGIEAGVLFGAGDHREGQSSRRSWANCEPWAPDARQAAKGLDQLVFYLPDGAVQDRSRPGLPPRASGPFRRLSNGRPTAALPTKIRTGEKRRSHPGPTGRRDLDQRLDRAR